MEKEQFFSLPNVFWFAAGLAAEVVFLGIGVSPTGMAWGAEIAETIGLVEPFNSAATAGAAGSSAPALASNGTVVFDF